jgi:uncharacterized protein YjiS (DUF1127 family)
MWLGPIRLFRLMRRFTKGVDELSRFTDRELWDIGITRSDIPRVVWENTREPIVADVHASPAAGPSMASSDGSRRTSESLIAAARRPAAAAQTVQRAHPPFEHDGLVVHPMVAALPGVAQILKGRR